MVGSLRFFVCFTSFSFAAYCASLDEDSAYFNTSFLIHYDQVTKKLIDDGFNEVNFNSADHLNLNGLYLQQPEAKLNVLLCCGFYPGRKEGLAAFYHLLPENTNILLFDARGHGKSEGYFLSKIPFYGMHEYNDIIGALRFLKEQNNKPTVILGMCAGAYHAVRAVDMCQKQQQLENLNVHGLILDSSIVSLSEAVYVPKKYFQQVVLPGFLRKHFYKEHNRHYIRSTGWYTFSRLCTAPLLVLFEYFLWPCAALRKEATDIRPLCAQLNVPLFFIHAQDDAFAPFHLAQACQDYATKYWWPKEAEHACIYLKHKYTYRDHVHAFIEQLLTE